MNFELAFLYLFTSMANKFMSMYNAFVEENLAVLQSLVTNITDLNDMFFSKYTPLTLAVVSEQFEIVDYLINTGVKVNGRDGNHYTALHYASRYGLLDIVQSILRKKEAHIDATLPDGSTPLLLAAKFSCTEVVELLINAGANVNCCGNGDWTALHYASSYGYLNVVQSILNKENVHLDPMLPNGNTPLLLATLFKHAEVAELLIKAGANVNICNAFKCTALHYASRNGLLKIVQSILKKEKVHIDATLLNGKTPLWLAIEIPHTKIVELLINAGANVNSCNAFKGTALHYASRKGLLKIVQSILKKETVHLNAENCDGQTPLHFASIFRNIKIIKHLLVAGADCNIKNNSGLSSFYFIIGINDANLVKLCIEKGAYFEPIDYNKILRSTLLKQAILQDTELCTKAVLNILNKNVSELYRCLALAKILPDIIQMKIGNCSQVANEVLQIVEHKINTRGQCNVLKVHPIALSILSAKTLVKYCKGKKRL